MEPNFVGIQAKFVHSRTTGKLPRNPVRGGRCTGRQPATLRFLQEELEPTVVENSWWGSTSG